MFKTWKYQYYVFIWLSLAVLAILLATNLIFYFYAESIVENNTVNTKLQTTQKVREQLDGMLQEMNTISISVNASNYIQQVLRTIPYNPTDNYFDKEPQIEKEIRDVLYSITGLQPLKGSIVILSRYMDYIHLRSRSESKIMTKEYIRSVPGVSELLHTNRIDLDYIILLPHRDRWSENGGKVISLIRPIRDNFNVYGLVEISYDIDHFLKLFSFGDQVGQVNFIVFDERGNTVLNGLSGDMGLSTEDFLREEVLRQSAGNMEITGKNGRAYAVTFAKLSRENWTVAMVEDMSVYRKPIVVLRNTTFFVYALIVVITLVFLYLYTQRITHPIRKLTQSIMKMNADDLKLSLPNQHTNNEIILLGEAFRKLLEEIKIHIERAEKAYQNELAANMAALQAQINPHFLYNTLSLISAQGLKSGNREVVEIVSALSDMFRYVTQQDSKKTYLYKEIQHIRNYLMLMKKRYEVFFQYSIHLDNTVASVQVPKLLLQPFVENMFQHAFTRVKPPWSIEIRGWAVESRWNIEFVDNGSGFDSESLERLNKRIQQIKEGAQTWEIGAQKNIGIINAFSRLYLMDPEGAFISIANRKEGGAIIRIGGRIRHVPNRPD